MTTYQGVLTALGVEHRVQILERLATAPASVGELADLLPISRPAVSQHLRVLHEQDLVTYHAAGTKNIYRLETAGLVALRDWLNDIWPTAFDRYVEYATAHTQAEEASP